MIYIYHGEDSVSSKNKLNFDTHNIDKFSINCKNINLENFINLTRKESLLPNSSNIILENYYSTNSKTQQAIQTVIKEIDLSYNFFLWENKKLAKTQLNMFPDSKVFYFIGKNALYECINSIRSKNTKNFVCKYNAMIRENLYDLFLYLIKKDTRKNILESKHQKIYL